MERIIPDMRWTIKAMFETTNQISNLSEVQKKTDPLWGVHTSKRKQQQHPHRMVPPSDVVSLV